MHGRAHAVYAADTKGADLARAASAQMREGDAAPHYSKPDAQGVNMWRTLLIAGMFVTIGGAFAPPNAEPASPPAPAPAFDVTMAQHRVALVIGNADYGDHPLASASRDAKA